MTDKRTTIERLTAVEVTLSNMDEKLDDVVEGVGRLEELYREQNGLLSEAVGKIRKHLKNHDEDCSYWTIQQYIAERPFKSIAVCVGSAVTIFAILIVSNETIVTELLEFLKLLL